MPNSTPTSTRASRIRYLVIALAALMSLLLYLSRYSLSYLINFIEEDLALTEANRGVVLSVFFFTYALMQVPAGWLSDRFGARVMLTAYIVMWSVFTGLVGVAHSMIMLVLLQLCFGAAQAGAYPTAASMISKWVPFAMRGTASSIVAVGGRLGGALQPVLSAYLLVSFVPMSVPAGFGEHELRDPAGLVKRLQGKDQRTKADESESEQKRLAEGDKLAKLLEKQLPISLTDLNVADEKQQRRYLAKALNEMLQRKDLPDVIDVANLSLTQEGYRLVKTPVVDLSEKQIVRRNRFILEAAFPKYLQKLYVHGWRGVSITYGLLGVVVAGLFFWGVRNRPSEHPACNEQEQQLIAAGRPETSQPHGRVRALPIASIVRSRSLWFSSISQFGTNFGWVCLVLMLPTFLKEVHHVPPISRGWLSSLPVVVGIAGMLSGGFLTDGLTRMVGVRWGRALPMASTRFLALAAFLVLMSTQSVWICVAAFCVVAFATDLGTAAVWAFKQDVGGRYVGSILGWGNMWGNFGAFLSPLLLNLITGEYKWELRFAACALAFGVSGIAALGVDARVPVVAADDE